MTVSHQKIRHVVSDTVSAMPRRQRKNPTMNKGTAVYTPRRCEYHKLEFCERLLGGPSAKSLAVFLRIEISLWPGASV